MPHFVTEPSTSRRGEAVPYAEGRTYFDADSHIMETSDWLVQFADPGIRGRIRPLYLGGAGAMADEAVRQAEARRGDAEAARRLEANLLKPKGWSALGAFDPTERSRALDLLGFESQLVFSTFAPTQFLGDDPEVVEGGIRAHNRGMAAFCADDPRLVAVGSVFWMTPEKTVQAIEEAIDMGCGAILVPSAPPKDKSPTHPDWDGVWSTLEERNVPFLLHIGGDRRGLRPQFHNNGRPVKDHLGGGENLRGKDFMVIHHSPEAFLSAMVLDGVLEQHPGLRGGAIELGAMWVVPWLRRLDVCQATFGRGEETMKNLPLKASEYVHRQLKFTPFPTEPVGWIIDQVGDDLLLFSSDYPHPEGTKDPLARFESTMDGVSDEARERFYSGNYAELLGMVPAAV